MTRPWAPVPDNSDFPVQNLPYGVFSLTGQDPRVGVAIGDAVLDLSQLDLPHRADFATASLNAFMSRGRQAWGAVRARLTELLTDQAHRPAVQPHLIPRSDIRLHLPFQVADYADFYASEHHATNLGKIFRPGQPPLTPNWKHLPIGYHGRAGTVVVSGTPVTRPKGQYMVADAAVPAFGPSRRLDIEAEVGFVVGAPSALGTSVPTTAFADHVFGVVLVNDWSARDIQAWEYAPLGPFLGKSFATSVSPWVVPLDALSGARVQPHQEPAPLPYLSQGPRWGLDITLEVRLNGHLVSTPPFGSVYWTADQQLAHMTSNGASLRTGDLYASGTVSGPRRDQRGSLIELTWNGAEPLELPDGSSRAYLTDGDTVTISASARCADGTRLGFGEVTGTIEAADA
ncbi:fumarylacetoacetase [Streptomyces sp. NBC_00878]|uniref:fumarylacetoacetase n=1 Tax=Streptomyces sp. NBC_00878 TaxID=2975854 RepID=UPI002253DB38|nr:fumarylacetoacetase [Streptomyces sp. NBC_00878]MCX4903404.1 fumarylacetoacetase [Streptomyces sp. NBC_00878]